MTVRTAPDTVLVIDDDPDFRSLVGIIGQVCGVPVVEACDCETGLKVLDREHARIKMILLDYFMPGMSSAACAGRIVQKARQDVQIVLVTAAVDAGLRAAELKLTRWVSKPIEPSSLMALLTQNRESDQFARS